MHKNYWFILLISLLWISCNEDEGQEFMVEEELQIFFDQFEYEAQLRGVTIDWDSHLSIAMITNIAEPGVVGQCQKNSEKPNELFFDRFYWSRASELEKEFIVFHELGHCILYRDHLDISDENGNCTSIMQSGLGECDKLYNQENKELLIDELFSQ